MTTSPTSTLAEVLQNIYRQGGGQPDEETARIFAEWLAEKRGILAQALRFHIETVLATTSAIERGPDRGGFRAALDRCTVRKPEQDPSLFVVRVLKEVVGMAERVGHLSGVPIPIRGADLTEDVTRLFSAGYKAPSDVFDLALDLYLVWSVLHLVPQIGVPPVALLGRLDVASMRLVRAAEGCRGAAEGYVKSVNISAGKDREGYESWVPILQAEYLGRPGRSPEKIYKDLRESRRGYVPSARQIRRYRDRMRREGII